MPGYIPKTIFSLVQPAVWSLSTKLFILTTDRKGSKKYRPTVNTFYETGLVTALYETLLMSPVLSHLEIRHEIPYRGQQRLGAPKRVDLWLRPLNGGHPILIKAGDFGVNKVHNDLEKIRKLNSNGTNWFLAFFRKEPISLDPKTELERSFNRRNGLNENLVDMHESLIATFNVYRPKSDPDSFGIALLRGK